MENVRRHQTLFRLHGPNIGPGDDRMVSASIFSNKLGAFVRALKAADKAVNGKVSHEYLIVKLSSSSPTVVLEETPRPSQAASFISRSGIDAFSACADAVFAGERSAAIQYGDCVKHIHELSRGALRSYGYAEVWMAEGKVHRIDDLLAENSNAVINPETKLPSDDGEPWFKGVVEASFDGTIKVLDIRGSLPAIKLILSAGGKEIDCVCHAEAKVTLHANFDRRVRVSGRAIYNGKSGLPRRVEVEDIKPITGPADFSVWRGSFEPFEPPEWDYEDA